jgi:hypothetical protein
LAGNQMFLGHRDRQIWPLRIFFFRVTSKIKYISDN